MEALRTRLALPVPDAVLDAALTHRSFAYEHPGVGDNERLEFLGDAVLGLAVTEELFVTHPAASESDLAKMRANVVSTRALAEVARDVGLGPCVRLGRGEVATGGRDKSSILADTVEAIIGAVHVAAGPSASRQLVLEWVAPLIGRAAEPGAVLDWKTELQERAAAAGMGAPVYVGEHSGPDHARVHTARVLLAGREWGLGTARVKKEAEQAAAKQACTEWDSTGPAGAGAP